MKKLEWSTEKRKVNELLPLSINPRKISEEKKQQLIKSIEKFNLAEIPVVNKDNTIISGHQRIIALQMIGRGEELIDVRIPNRPLTQNQIKQYNLISNTHAGQWDVEILQIEFQDVNTHEMWDFDIPGFDLPFIQELKTAVNKKEKKAVEYYQDNQWFLNIRCESEHHAQRLYEQFLEQGLDVKIVT